MFFSAGQTLARPNGTSHTIPPEVPLVWDPFEPPPAERTSLQIHCSGLFEHCGGESGHYVKVNTTGSVHSLYWALRVTSILGPCRLQLKCDSSCGYT